MQLTASVEVSYWKEPSGGSQSVTRSRLVIGKEPTSKELFLLLQSAQNKVGVRYKISGNIEKVFMRFAKEGKATVRFREPPHDLIIKAENEIPLQSFLYFVKQGAAEGGLGPLAMTRLSSLNGGSSLPKKKVTSMLITRHEDYPFLTSFPRTLKALTVNGIGMKYIDTKVTRLRLLVSLNLSENLLIDLPQALGNLPLANLDLAGNSLGESPDWSFLQGTLLAGTLRSLDLSRNGLMRLPNWLGDVSELYSLRLGGNVLRFLPESLGRLKNLRHLLVSDNKIDHLPGAMTRLHLDVIDVSGNAFGPPANTREMIPPKRDRNVPRLHELAARSVRAHGLHYRGSLPMVVTAFLDDSYICACGVSCFESVFLYPFEMDLRMVAVNVRTDFASQVPAMGAFCSPRCFATVRRTSRYAGGPKVLVGDFPGPSGNAPTQP